MTWLGDSVGPGRTHRRVPLPIRPEDPRRLMGPPDPTANHPAENALIGAALINKAAAETVATIPGPAWHHPTHARWATAITQHVAAPAASRDTASDNTRSTENPCSI